MEVEGIEILSLSLLLLLIPLSTLEVDSDDFSRCLSSALFMIHFQSNGPLPLLATISDLDDPTPPPTRSLYIIYNLYKKNSLS